MVSTATTVASPGQAARVTNGARSVLAKTRRRTRRPWPSSNASKQGRSGAPSGKALPGGHGRLVRRRVFACADLTPFATLADWPGLATVVAVETIRGIPGRGKVTAEIRHYLSSAKLPPEALAAAIRSHWRVENGLHWVLDVGFREDASRVRERNAARNLALLRKIALNLARSDTTLKASLKGKRKYAGWDDTFMATLMAG